MLARQTALIIATQISNGLLGYVALFFITRYLEPSDYGVVAFALGFVALFSLLENLGFHHAHIKKISEGKDFGYCNGTFLVIKIFLTLILGLVVIIAIYFWTSILNRGFESSFHEIAIYIMLMYHMIRSISYFFIVSFRAKKQIAKRQISLFIENFIRVAATIFVAIAGYGALELALTYVAGELCFLIAGAILFRGYPLKKPSFEFFKEYSVFAFPLIIVVASSVIMTNLDKVLIQLFWSASDVGYYFAAFRLSYFIDMIAIAMITVLFPTYSSLHARKNIAGIRQLTFQSERYISMIVFPMVFGMIVLAEPATRMLLSGWMPAIPILRILPLFALFAALESPYQSQFIGTNRPILARNRVLLMVSCNIILNILLIPKDIQSLGIKLGGLGAEGAAIATVVSYTIGLIYSRAMAWKTMEIKGNNRIIIHAFSAIIMLLILYLGLYIYGLVNLITRWYLLLSVSLFGLGIYFIILYLMKEFTKEDIKFFLDTLNIKKMYSYIFNELKQK